MKKVGVKLNTLSKNVLICFGEGGHAAQAQRLLNLMSDYDENIKFITFSDSSKPPIGSDYHYVTDEVRDKYSWIRTIFNLNTVRVVKMALHINRNHDISCVISTGPGVAILASVIFKIRGVKVIHIETWSRFESISLTGRIMHILADVFYVQNKSLLKLYKNAIYSGRL